MGELDLILPKGSVTRDRVSSGHPLSGWGNGAWAAGAAANRAIFFRFRVDRDITVANAKWWIGAAAGNIDAALGTFDGTTFTRLSSTGSTAAAGTNVIQTKALGASVRLSPGVDYAGGMVADTTTTLTVGRVTPTEGFLIADDLAYFANSQFPIGASVALTVGTGGAVFYPFIEFTP